MAEAAIRPAQQRAPDLVHDEHVRTCRRAIEKWDSLVDTWFDEPLTLLHGDSHLANCFEVATEREETMRTVLARSLAAVDRVGFEDWLARL